MNTLRTMHWVSATVALGLLVGCSKSDHTPPQGVSGVTPEGQMDMQFKWVIGKQYAMRMSLVQTSETDVPNMPQPMKQDLNMTQDYTIAVLQELENGGRELELEFTGMKLESKTGDRALLSFDSDQDPSQDAANPVAPLLRRIVGGKLKYVTDADGRVDRVEGVRELAARIAQGGPPQAQAMLSSMFSEGYFKQLCDSARMAPESGVKPGSTWNMDFQEDMGPIGVMTVQANMKFENWEQHGTRKCARIKSTGQISSQPSESATARPPAMSIAIENGESTGTGWFDPQLGMVVESDADQTMTMKITTQGRTMASRLKQKVNLKLVDVTNAPY